MFCYKCGADNPDGANFCIKCGNSLNFTEPLNKPNEVPATNQSLINEAQNCNSLMVIGIIFSLLNYIPYVNIMSGIVSFIVTILGMSKVISFCKQYVTIDPNAAYIEKMTSTLRLHYIATLVAGIAILILTVFLVAATSYHGDIDERNCVIGLLLVALLIYNCAISLWCLIRWFSIREFILEAKSRLSKA